MAFGINRVELIGRLGADVTVNHLVSGDARPISASRATSLTSTRTPARRSTGPSGTAW